MRIDLKAVVVTLTNCLLYLLVVMGNTSIGSYGVHVSVTGLYLVVAILHLRFKWALPVMAFQALLLDSSMPLEAFGFHFVLMLSLLTAMTYLKSTIRRGNLLQILILCTGLTALIIVAQGIYWGSWAQLTALSYWLRLLVDIGASALVLLMITKWFIILQRYLIFFAGSDFETEEEGRA